MSKSSMSHVYFDMQLIREMKYKIYEVIKFLEKNDGHSDLRCNRSCNELDSNIVEYAEDILSFFENNCNPTPIFDDIYKVIIQK